MMLSKFVSLFGGYWDRQFIKSCREVRLSQKRLLDQVLLINRNTEYGKIHSFSLIRTESEYRAGVPIIHAADIAEYQAQMCCGVANQLTGEAPVWFARTSGTTAQPKFIPFTTDGLRAGRQMIRIWLYRAQVDHPGLLSQGLLTLTAPEKEGLTSSGLPYGSASGMSNQSLPSLFKGAVMFPNALAQVRDVSVRYYLLARIALARKISFMAAPSALSLQKMAECVHSQREEIIRAIANGWLSSDLRTMDDGRSVGLPDIYLRYTRPDRERAKFLERVFAKSVSSDLSDYWPELKLIGCWLGGSIGIQAQGLRAFFAKVPFRDLGYMASEGIFTIPLDDEQSAGLPTVMNNYFEFFPAEQELTSDTQTLGIEQLERGQSYRTIVTNRQGLYRCDLDDIVEVKGIHSTGLPLLAFARKACNYLNIAGEKLHLNHFLTVMASLRRDHGLEISQFRIFANQDLQRYEVLLALRPEPTSEYCLEQLIPSIDSILSSCNIEYGGKRVSGRLHLPCVHLMAHSWESELRRRSIEGGQRDIQLKWQSLTSAMLPSDREYIVRSEARDA